jgi:toxin YoeB
MPVYLAQLSITLSPKCICNNQPLKFDLAGLWSRRIDLEHRLAYSLEGEDLLIYACRFHFDKK